MIKRFLALLCATVILSSGSLSVNGLKLYSPPIGVSRSEILSIKLSTPVSLSSKVVPLSDKTSTNIMEVEPTSSDSFLSDEEIRLIALLTMAEAEGESSEGQRLVIDTVLNRADSEHFPNSIRDVIYQPNQFTPIWNGRIERCEVREEICQLVREELTSRLNYDVVFFNAGHYSDYGVPLFQVGHHYFSAFKEVST